LRIAFAYPPLGEKGRYPLLGQNRQFRYSTSSHVRIYPLIPATAVTLLDESYDSILLDGINSRIGSEAFLRRLDRYRPDVVVLETKTPLMPKLWRWADELKERFDTVIMVGDHVSARPRESLERCRADYILGGGDYDLGLLELTRHIAEKDEPLPGGVWYRGGGGPRSSGDPAFWDDLDRVPFIDREKTNWRLYGEAYLHDPCTYVLSGRGCGGAGGSSGRCSYCSWQHNLWRCTSRLRTPANLAEEIALIVEEQGPKEIFDDNESGAVWNLEWLKAFERELSKRGVKGEVAISSNARADSLNRETCRILARGGFRLLKIGLESGNDRTLKRIGKMETSGDIERGVKNAKEAGLKVLLTVMVGYPWEDEGMVRKTLDLAGRLLRYRARIGDSLQASIIVPYPGTPLHREAVEEDLFAIDPEDYAAYDMSRPVLESPIDPAHWCGRLWRLHYDPRFLVRSLASVRSLGEMMLAARGVSSLLGHTGDFGK